MTNKVSLRVFIRFIMLKESQSSPNLTLSPKLILKYSKRLQAEKYCVIDKLKKLNTIIHQVPQLVTLNRGVPHGQNDRGDRTKP